MQEAKKYQKLEEDLAPFKPLLGSAADTILDQDVSFYPIFVVHQLSVDLGLPLMQRDEQAGVYWSVNVTTLEELVTKQVVEQGKISEFKKVYKDPQASLCLFVLSDLGAQFVFIPRGDDSPTR